MSERAPASHATAAVRCRFGRNLAARRHEAGFTQEVVGIRAGLHRTEIGLLERGERIPRIDTAIRLAGALDVPLSALTEGIEWTVDGLGRGLFSIDAEMPDRSSVGEGGPVAGPRTDL